MAKAKLEGMVAVKGDGDTNIIGKLLYYSIGKTLIKEEKVKQIMEACGMKDDLMSNKFTNTHTFKTVTKQLEQKRKLVAKDGSLSEIYKIRILDNSKEGNLVVREIKKEVIREKKNDMIYLGNLIYDKTEDKVTYTLNPVQYGSLDFDLKASVEATVELFEYAKGCYNENRIVNFVEKYVTEMLDASPISIHGKLFFVPIYKNEEIVKLEQFLEMIDEANELEGEYNYASIPVMDDEKYVKEYTKEFYAMAEQEIETYQKRFQHFIEEGQASEKILTGWIDKVQKLIDKKKKYEEVFKQSLDNINDDLEIINRQIRELSIRMERKKNGEGA